MSTNQYIHVSTATALVRQSWDATSYTEMTEFLGWVLGNLRIRDERVRVYAVGRLQSYVLVCLWASVQDSDVA